MVVGWSHCNRPLGLTITFTAKAVANARCVLTLKLVRLAVAILVISLAMATLFNVPLMTFYSIIIGTNGGGLRGGSTGQREPPSTNSTLVRSIQFETIATGALSRYYTPENLVIDNSATWSDVWTHSTTCRYECSPPPAIDFNSTTVLAVFLGLRGNDAYEIQIVNVNQIGPKVIVDIRITAPGNNCVVPTLMTQPFDIVSIPKTTASVSFKAQTTIHDCGSL